MAKKLGGDDPAFELPRGEKRKLEAIMRALASQSLEAGKPKEAKRHNARAKEISREKSRRGHQGRD